MGVKFGMEEGTFGPLLHAKFHPHRCNVSPMRGEKPQNWPLSKLNTGRFALRAMLPVINQTVLTRAMSGWAGLSHIPIFTPQRTWSVTKTALEGYSAIIGMVMAINSGAWCMCRSRCRKQYLHNVHTVH